MGHHYVPQYYLRGFSPDGRSIWVYDKQEGRSFCTQVKSTANETGFYSDDMESRLANEVETPANAVLDRVRERSALTSDDRGTLAAYITCMAKRVPRGRERVRELAPSVARQIEQQWDERIRQYESEHPEKRDRLQQQRETVQRIIEKWKRDPPEEAWLDNLPPDKTPQAVDTLVQMTWRFLVHERAPAFLTSDNPVFYPEGFGIIRPESEVVFPISSHIALWASWRDVPKVGYLQVRDSTVRRVNRRTASITTRFAYHAVDADWVIRLLKKTRRQIDPLP